MKRKAIILQALGTMVVLSIFDFLRISRKFKKEFEIQEGDILPVLDIIENRLYFLDPKFNFSIISDKEWHYPKTVQAYYLHSKTNHEIIIRESVYNKALEKDINAIITLTHEISHWALFNFFSIDSGKEVKYAPFFKRLYIQIDENITDLLTCLLVTSEEEIVNAKNIKDFKYASHMSKRQLEMTLFYCQGYDMFKDNYRNHILPALEKKNKEVYMSYIV